jgi:hypothetical protein
MKTMRIFLRMYKESSIVLERNACTHMQVHWTPYDKAYTCSVLRIYARDNLSNFVDFHFDNGDRFFLNAHIDEVDYFVPITKVSLYTPVVPCEDVEIIMFDVDEYKKVKKYLERI